MIKLKQHQNYDKIVSWVKLISITSGAQFIVQAVGFASGILIIRVLPVQEYALYTLANTMLGTMTILADSGISTGVMAQGGKVWQDRERLGTVLATGLDLRRKFAIGSLVVSTPILFYLLLHNNATWLTSCLIVLALVPAFYATLSDSLLEIVPKLHQAIMPLQRNQVNVGIGRLLLTTLTLFVFPWAAVAIIASSIPRIYGNVKLRKITEGFVDMEQKPDPIVKSNIFKILKRQYPESIYYCLNGQINIWLISIFGTSTSLANLGAIGRFGVVISFFAIIFSTLVYPSIAKSPEIKKIILSKSILIIIGSILLSILILIFTRLFSTQILWILGDNYSKLKNELFLSVLLACISLIQGVFFSMNLSRGWVINPIFYILLSIIITIFAVATIDLSTILGVLYFSLAISSCQSIILISYWFKKVLSLKV